MKGCQKFSSLFSVYFLYLKQECYIFFIDSFVIIFLLISSNLFQKVQKPVKYMEFQDF